MKRCRRPSAAPSGFNRLILHLQRDDDHLSLWGEVLGRRVATDELRNALRFLFHGWQHVILEGRGVLHVLQGLANGLSAPHVVCGADLNNAVALYPFLTRLIAGGRVAPIYQHGQARWRATLLPKNVDVKLLQALVDTWMRTCSSTTLTRAQARRHKFYTTEDAWLCKLRGQDAQVVPANPQLETQLVSWASPLFTGDRASLYLVPRHDEAGWWLDVQPSDANQLRLLGQAIAIAPMLATPQPWSHDTFARFIQRAIPDLRAAAFHIPLPAELEPSSPELIETAVELTDETVTVRQTLCFAGVELSIEEAYAILDASEPFAWIQGEWRYVDLNALRELLENRGPNHLPKRTALPLLLAGVFRIAPTAQAIQDFLREMTTPPDGDLPLRDILRPYQAQGVCWLMQAAHHHLGVCLADDMGLGKTLQTIAFLLTRSGPTLIVAPLTVLPVWEHEFARWAPQLTIYRHDGPLRHLRESFAKVAQSADVTLTAYGYLHRDFQSLRKLTWNTLVLDEAQAIKNPHTRQSQIARSLTANFRLTLTGTPIENKLDDLWTILDFLNPDLFGDRKSFVERYTHPEKLRRAVAHFLLRRLKTDPSILSELPPKLLQTHYPLLTPSQSAAYDLALANYARDQQTLLPGERAGAILALLTRLKQICDHPALVEAQATPPAIADSGKLLLLLPLIQEILEKGESVLIFTQYVRMGELIVQLFAEHLGKSIPFLHGGLTPVQRREQLRCFNEDPDPSVLLLSLRTGAFGLTLTKANHVIHLDRWWNPAVENQATDRVHRIGQQRTVVVHHLICRGTFEDAIGQMLREKTALAQSVVAPTPAALLAKLPADTLLGLLKRQGE